MFNSQFIIKDTSVGKIVDKLLNTVHSEGEEFETHRGLVKAVNSVNIILEEPNNPKDLYTYWDSESVTWYLNSFVRPQSPPEEENQELIFPYTYAWRSRFYDNGWGHAQLLTQLLQDLNYSDLPFSRVEDIHQLLDETHRLIHPDVVLAILAWLKKDNMLMFLMNPQLVSELKKAQRVDLIDTILKQIRKTPTTRKAITPSLLYGTIDVYGILEHTPAYQNFQVIVNFDKKGKPIGFETFHHHRALNADGSAQLDLLHDLEWGLLIGKQIGLDLQRITIHTNQLFVFTDRPVNQETTTIQNELLKATGGYSPKNYNLQSLISTKKYIEKTQLVLNLFNS